MIRAAESADKQDIVRAFVEAGSEVVTGDLTDQASLDRATTGIDVIVSTVQGGADVIGRGAGPRIAGKNVGTGLFHPRSSLDLR